PRPPPPKTGRRGIADPTMTAATARRMVERRMSEGIVECISRMLIHPEPAASSSLPWPSADRLRGGPDAAGGIGGDAPRHGAADTERRLTSGRRLSPTEDRQTLRLGAASGDISS